ncbi:hypothetical protein CR513_23605, partial [Mucuna pruriens]
MKFLMGLNKKFSMVRSQMLLMDPLLSMNRVLSKALHNVLSLHEKMQSIVNAADGKRYNSKGKGNFNTKQCTYCGIIGHTIEVCYKKHGYPPKPKSGTIVNNSVSENSKVRSEESLVERFGNQQNEEKKQHSRAHICSNPNSHSTNLLDTPSADINHVFSRLSNKGTVDWVVDSGSDHACTSLSWFQTYNKIPSIVKDVLKDELVGDVKISESLVLKDVLFLPQFNFNLVPISQLTKSAHCRFLFADNKWSIQDSQSRILGLNNLPIHSYV